MTNEMRKELYERLCKVTAELGEHFDAIQVMATICDEEGTSSLFRGTGNWFARQGLAHEFITADVAELHGREIAKKLEDR